MAQSWPGMATFKQSKQDRGLEQMPPEYHVHESPLLEDSVLGALVNTMEPSSLVKLDAFSLPTSFALLFEPELLMPVGGRNRN